MGNFYTISNLDVDENKFLAPLTDQWTSGNAQQMKTMVWANVVLKVSERSNAMKWREFLGRQKLINFVSNVLN